MADNNEKNEKNQKQERETKVRSLRLSDEVIKKLDDIKNELGLKNLDVVLATLTQIYDEEEFSKTKDEDVKRSIEDFRTTVNHLSKSFLEMVEQRINAKAAAEQAVEVRLEQQDKNIAELRDRRDEAVKAQQEAEEKAEDAAKRYSDLVIDTETRIKTITDEADAKVESAKRETQSHKDRAASEASRAAALEAEKSLLAARLAEAEGKAEKYNAAVKEKDAAEKALAAEKQARRDDKKDAEIALAKAEADIKVKMSEEKEAALSALKDKMSADKDEALSALRDKLNMARDEEVKEKDAALRDAEMTIARLEATLEMMKKVNQQKDTADNAKE